MSTEKQIRKEIAGVARSLGRRDIVFSITQDGHWPSIPLKIVLAYAEIMHRKIPATIPIPASNACPSGVPDSASPAK